MSSSYKVIKTNDHVKLGQLISSGVDVNSSTNVGHGYTLLEVSITYDAWDCFQLLLAHGADINGPSARDDTGVGWVYYPIDNAVEKLSKRVIANISMFYMLEMI